MLSSIFQKRRKIQELRSPALQDIKKFRDVYARHAERRHVETPSCLEKSVYKAISCQKELHSVDFRQEDITDPQLMALAESLLEMPMISYLDLRDNRITDDGAKALLEVLRLQIITAKSPLKIDPRTKLPIIPTVPEYTRYVTQVLIKGNEISPAVVQELAQYTEILKREDKRVEIRAALAQIDRNSTGGIDEDEFKAVLKLLTGAEPSRKEVRMLMQQHTQSSESLQQSAVNLENLLLAKCSSSPSKRAACPPWEALVQVRHATLGQSQAGHLAKAKSLGVSELAHSIESQALSAAAGAHMYRSQSQQVPHRSDASHIQVALASSEAHTGGQQRSLIAPPVTASAMALPPPPLPPSPPPQQAPSSPTSLQQQSPVSSHSSSSEQTAAAIDAYAKVNVADFKSPAPSPPPLPLQRSMSVSSSPDTKSTTPRSLATGPSTPFRESHDSVTSELSIREASRAHTPASSALTETPAAVRAANSLDRASAYSSSSSSFSQYIDSIDTPQQQSSATAALGPTSTPTTPATTTSAVASRSADESLEKTKKPALVVSTTAAAAAATAITESPRWRDDNVFTDDDDDDDRYGSRAGATAASARDQLSFDGDARLASRAGNVVGAGTPSSNSAAISSSSPVAATSTSNLPITRASELRRIDSGTITSDIVELSDGEGAPSPIYRPLQASSDATGSKEKDLSSLIYRAAVGDDSAGRSASSSAWRQSPVPAVPSAPSLNKSSGFEYVAEPQTADDNDDDDDNCTEDLVVAEVTKDGKPRCVAKVTHSLLRRGLLLKDVAADVPLRHLVALTLSANGLASTECLKECRFPCAIALDLSRNRLAKLSDDDFIGFPKLEVLDLAHNRLRSFQGLGRVVNLRALNGAYNAIKSVTNIEHLAQLEVLSVAHNFVASIAALRLLSLNRALAHLDVDNNPIVATDERQTRRVIVHVMNLVPTLRSLGSIPVASLQAKEKKLKLSATASAAVPQSLRGKALYDVDDRFPGFEMLWTMHACELLQCFQDVSVAPKRHSSYNNDNDDDDDQWGRSGRYDDDDGDSAIAKKPLNSKQQRHKDEVRSRAVGYRSRAKAMPSPPKMKLSVYSFGPPVPPPLAPTRRATAAKKSTDPRVVKQQQRRASELSAPKHQPVDTTLLSQEQKRKSRPTFDLNMSVAERLLLAQEKAKHRSSSNSRASGSKRLSEKRSTAGQRTTSVGTSRSDNERLLSQQQQHNSESIDAAHELNASSPKRAEHHEVVAFRIEPLRSQSASPATSVTRGSPASTTPTTASAPLEAVESTFVRSRTAPSLSPTSMNTIVPSPKPELTPTAAAVATPRERNFLQDLAVTDFLSHADEELSTALTALTVLLRMSERASHSSDDRKLAEFRSSLDALGILDERASHAMFATIERYVDDARAHECSMAFSKLGTVKQSLRALLAQLETHALGSNAIRAFCQSLRATNLRNILSASDADADAETNSDAADTGAASSSGSNATPTTSSPVGVPAATHSSDVLPSIVKTIDAAHTTPSMLFSVKPSTVSAAASTTLSTDTDLAMPSDDAAEDDEFAFLSTEHSVFADDDDPSADASDAIRSDEPLTADVVDADPEPASTPSPQRSPTPVYSHHEAATYSVATDITHDIQTRGDDDLLTTDALSTDDRLDAVEPLVSESNRVVADGSEQNELPANPDDLIDDAWLITETSSALDDLSDAASHSEKDAHGAPSGGDTGVDVTGTVDDSNDNDWLATGSSALDAFGTDDAEFLSGGDATGHTPDRAEELSSLETVDDQEGTVDSAYDDTDDTAVDHDAFEAALNSADDDVTTDEYADDVMPEEYAEDGTHEEYADDDVTTDFYAEMVTNDESDTDVTTDKYMEGGTTDKYAEDGTTDKYAEDGTTTDEYTTDITAEDDNIAPVEPLLSDGEDADDEEAEMFGDWEKGFDPSTNHYFWFNHATGESAWTPPDGWPYEIDTPFEADEVEGEVEGEGDDDEAEAAFDNTEVDVDDSDDAAAQDDDSADAADSAIDTTEHDDNNDDDNGDDDAAAHAACTEWGDEGEHSALERSSSRRALSDVDDDDDADLFSDQDLPVF